MDTRGQDGIALLTAWFIAILQCGIMMLAALWLATRPAIFDRYYSLLVHTSGSRDAHEIVAWLSSNRSPENLLSQVTQGHLSRKELNHYAEVRSWLGKVPISFLFCAGMFVALFIICRAWTFWPIIEGRALVFMVLLLCGCIGLASWDWRIFFSWVHYPLFGATSWRFPRGSYSLMLFPASFWRVAGILVAAPTMVAPILLLAFKRRIRL